MIIRRAIDIGSLIRGRRKSKGLTQQEFANLIGASRLWVSQVERGKPSAHMGLILRALAELGLALEASETVADAPTKRRMSVRGVPLININEIADGKI